MARLVPRPDVPSAVRKLPAPKPIPEPPVLASITAASTPTAGPHDGVNPAAPSASLELAAQAAAPPPSRRRPVVSALSPDRYQISFTASAKTIEKLRLAQDLLRHTVPTGDTTEIFDRALTALLEDLARKKCAATQRPRPGRGAAKGSRHIPAAVRREVWLRDGGRCAFVGKGGRRCGERAFLEFHHLEPYAAGGSATVENIQLRCRSHNVYEAELYFGPIKPGEGIISELRAAYGRLDDQATRSGTSWSLEATVFRA